MLRNVNRSTSSDSDDDRVAKNMLHMAWLPTDGYHKSEKNAAEEKGEKNLCDSIVISLINGTNS